MTFITCCVSVSDIFVNKIIITYHFWMRVEWKREWVYLFGFWYNFIYFLNKHNFFYRALFFISVIQNPKRTQYTRICLRLTPFLLQNLFQRQWLYYIQDLGDLFLLFIIFSYFNFFNVNYIKFNWILLKLVVYKIILLTFKRKGILTLGIHCCF